MDNREIAARIVVLQRSVVQLQLELRDLWLQIVEEEPTAPWQSVVGSSHDD